MKKILIFNGSMRPSGNTSIMARHFREGATQNTSNIETILAHEANLKYCTGCLRCNLIKRCSISGDDWPVISQKIAEADILVFATPVYFHHISAPLKKILDRFRSFIKIQITEDSIEHTPHYPWKKDIVLLLPMGSSDGTDAKPIIDLFQFISDELGENNRLHVISGTRLAVIKHIQKSEEELKVLYKKLNLPLHLAFLDSQRNNLLLEECYALGKSLSDNR